jgi:hypothetical protein
MTVNEPYSGILNLKGIVTHVFFDSTLELPQGANSLHKSRCTYRMPAGQKSSGGVHGDIFKSWPGDALGGRGEL